MLSHEVWQQNGSTAQTVSQQAVSAHPGVPSGLGAQQSFALGGQPTAQASQSESASDAQMLSQAVSQQNGSTAQTASQQAVSEHPGVPEGDATQQSFGLSGPQTTGAAHSALFRHAKY
jgi:hypothetical protein